MILQSPAFDDGQPIPTEYSCEGKDRSPELTWKDVPAGTRSLALTCVDPDAPMGDWIHWIAWNISPSQSSLPAGMDPVDQTRFTQGTNSWGRTGYGGPCPPPGHGTHHYYFTLFALDVDTLHLDSGARLPDLQALMEGHILAKATLMGTYER
ncbi:MAG: YbhB/YbcL family Raf kinase inhibitor-like protein [Candidatus Neomarinimicrobiota bacterium]|nr:MAG: YbhB/YbcL family Raf kinase inhibitor-like protein [Candidatus Neomarinimicrobiota bacterium]